MRFIAVLCFLVAITGAWAQWSVTTLNTPGDLRARAYAIDGEWVVGEATVNGAIHACMWNRVTNAWIDLHPAGADESTARGVHNGQQVGWVTIGGLSRAILWTGTAASAVDITPAAATEAQLFGIHNGQQVGWARVSGDRHASLWTGTAASWVDINPAGCDSSLAYCVRDGVQGGYLGYNAPGLPEGAVLWAGSAASARSMEEPGNTSHGRIYAMADGQQVGEAGSSARIWNGSAPSMGSLGFSNSQANGVMGGMQVGEVRSPSIRAYVWGSTYPSGVALPGDRAWAQAIWQDATNSYVVGYSDAPQGTLRARLWTGPLAPNDDFTFALSKSVVAGSNFITMTITSPTTFPQDARYRIYCDRFEFQYSSLNLTLPAGQTTVSKYMSVQEVYTSTIATFGAQRGSIRKTQSIVLVPLAPSAMAFTPNQVTGGQSVQCRVVLNGRLGYRTFDLNVSDDSAFAITPPTVTVPFKSTQAIFTIQTLPVVTRQTVRVTISNAYGTITGTFRIYP